MSPFKAYLIDQKDGKTVAGFTQFNEDQFDKGEVTIKVQQNGHTVRGRGVSVDIVEASAKAYVNAINKLIALEGSEKEAAKGV